MKKITLGSVVVLNDKKLKVMSIIQCSSKAPWNNNCNFGHIECPGKIILQGQSRALCFGHGTPGTIGSLFELMLVDSKMDIHKAKLDQEKDLP